MLAGKQIRLERDTPALRGGQRIVLAVGELIHVIFHQKESGMLNVLWRDRTLTMFEVDLDGRATEFTVVAK